MLWLWLTMVHAEVPKTIPDAHVRGKQLYDDLCFQCHGATGLADSPMAQSTKSPALAGVVDESNFPEAIKLIQEGKGLMPAYEMVIDKHDTKRILIYLSRLDSETGLDPNQKTAPDTDDTKEGAKEEVKETTPSKDTQEKKK